MAGESGSGAVVMYSTVWCGYCRRLKAQLAREGIEFHEIDIEGERVELDPETMVRVGADTKRKLLAGDDGIRVLIIGGVPGAAYVPGPGTEIGAPAPKLGNRVA